ncbi:MAG: hypothetical protein AB8B77_02005 [Alphaproteobacteria bacterium]
MKQYGASPDGVKIWRLNANQQASAPFDLFAHTASGNVARAIASAM